MTTPAARYWPVPTSESIAPTAIESTPKMTSDKTILPTIPTYLPPKLTLKRSGDALRKATASPITP